MTQTEKEVHPQKELGTGYDESYKAFIQLLEENDYLKREAYA